MGERAAWADRHFTIMVCENCGQMLGYPGWAVNCRACGGWGPSELVVTGVALRRWNVEEQRYHLIDSDKTDIGPEWPEDGGAGTGGKSDG